jgi:hypothetical protein
LRSTLLVFALLSVIEAQADILTEVRRENFIDLRVVGTSQKVSPLCARLGFTQMRIENVAAFANESNFCQMEEQKIPVEILTAMQQMSDLASRAANALGTTREELLPQGLNITLYGDPAGWLISSAGSVLYMGVFPDWPKGQAEPIHSGVFVHELAHVIQVQRSQVFPPMFYALIQHPMTTEGFADALAIALFGELFTPDPTVPDCVREVRKTTLEDTYNRETDFFQYHPVRLLQSCCRRELPSYPKNTRFRGICDFASSYTLPEADLTPFDPGPADGYAYHFQGDTHQYGIPLNALWMDIARRTGRSFAEVFREAFSALPEEASHDYRCHLSLPDGPSHPVPFPGHRLDIVWERSLGALPEKEAQEVREAHGMTTGHRLEWQLQTNQTIRGSGLQMLERMEKNTDSFYTRTNACFEGLKMIWADYLTGECALRCLPENKMES